MTERNKAIEAFRAMRKQREEEEQERRKHEEEGQERRKRNEQGQQTRTQLLLQAMIERSRAEKASSEEDRLRHSKEAAKLDAARKEISAFNQKTDQPRSQNRGQGMSR